MTPGPRVRTRSLRPPATGLLAAIELSTILFLALTAVIALQVRMGAYAAELSGDDASHYISGLLIHDYLVGGWHQSPIEFLKNFHSHYPLVGIGHWPPLYYFVEAVWMVVFSPSRVSVLVLSGLVTAVTAVACAAFVGRRIGKIEALFVAFAFVTCPIAQSASSELMLDVPVALLCLLSMFSYVRYLEMGFTRHSAAFGVLAASAMMVKGNGACLALLPPIMVLLGRRFDLLRRISFWTPVPIVLVATGPWYLFTYGLAEQGFRFGWGWTYFETAVSANTGILLASLGPALLTTAIVGLLLLCVRCWFKAFDDYGPLGAAALALAVLIFQSVVPAAIQDRYLAPALPPLLILAAYALRTTSNWLVDRVMPARTLLGHANILAAGGVLILALSFLPRALELHAKPRLGLIEAARQVWMHRTASNPSVLIASDGQGEGSAIVELAMSDPNRPSIFAVRGSRLLGGGGYNNQDYLPRFKTTAEAMTAIDEYAIPLVLLRTSGAPEEWAHLRQIDEARRSDVDRWKVIYSNSAASPNVTLFQIRGNDEQIADRAKLMALSGPRGLSQ